MWPTVTPRQEEKQPIRVQPAQRQLYWLQRRVLNTSNSHMCECLFITTTFNEPHSFCCVNLLLANISLSTEATTLKSTNTEGNDIRSDNCISENALHYFLMLLGDSSSRAVFKFECSFFVIWKLCHGILDHVRLQRLQNKLRAVTVSKKIAKHKIKWESHWSPLCKSSQIFAHLLVWLRLQNVSPATHLLWLNAIPLNTIIWACVPRVAA